MIGMYYTVDELTAYKLNGNFSITQWLELPNKQWFSVEESWDILDHLLKNWRGGSVTYKMVLGGRVLQDSDERKAFLLLAKDVEEISKDISTLDYEWFDVCFNLREMMYNDVHYASTSSLSRRELVNYAYGYFEGLKAFFAQASQNKQGLIFLLSRK